MKGIGGVVCEKMTMVLPEPDVPLSPCASCACGAGILLCCAAAPVMGLVAEEKKVSGAFCDDSQASFEESLYYVL